MKCKLCKEEILDGSEFCPKCGADQKTGFKPAAYTKPCTHCNETATCKNAKIGSKEFSCEACIVKFDKKLASPFPIVPCSYCNGKGYHVIEAAKPKQQNTNQQQRQGKNNQQQNNQSGGNNS